MRVFVALALGDGLRARLVRWCAGCGLDRLGWRVVRRESLHLTLRFLGEQDEAELPRLGQAVQQAAARCRRFDFAVGGWGIFPERGRPRVLGAGIGDGRDALCRLARLVRRDERGARAAPAAGRGNRRAGPLNGGAPVRRRRAP